MKGETETAWGDVGIVSLASALAVLLVGLTLASPEARADGHRHSAYVHGVPRHTVIFRPPPDGRHELPAGRVTVTPTAIPAGDPSQKIEVTLRLSRTVRDGTFGVRVPARWSSSERSRTIVATLAGAPAGAKVKVTLERLDPPAGTYSLALLWRRGSGKPTLAGRARVVVLGRTLLPALDAGARARRPVRVAGARAVESYDFGSDPSVAADPFGNLWLSFVAFVTDLSGEPIDSRVVVNRVAAGAGGFQGLNTGLPRRASSFLEDKNMMAADTAPGSPHFGRLYVVWNENSFDGNQNAVISFCDTFVSGAENPVRCEDPSKWTAPAPVTDEGGSHIAADVAAAPNGDVYVVWWDFSAANRIEGDVCRAGADCSRSSGWGPDQAIDTLNGDGGPIPFSCPMLAAPGGRVNPAPSVVVNSVAPSGRVYVTHGDVRPGSTKCLAAPSDGQWDVFVSSELNALPALNSGVSLTGGLDGDNFLPWTDADEATGAAAMAFYKTSPDPTRLTALYATRPVDPTTGTPTGVITTLAAEPSEYGLFTTDFDYGDYNGIDAANGKLYPVWTDGREAFPCCEVLFRKVAAGSLGDEKNLTLSPPEEDAIQGAETSVATTGSGDGTAVLVGANNLAAAGPPMLAFLSRDDGASFTQLSVPTGASVVAAPAAPAAPVASTPPPATGTLDRRAPRLQLRIRRRQAIGRRGAVVVRASCDERCTLSVRGAVRVRRGGRQKLKKVVRRLGPGVDATFKLRFSRRDLARVSRALLRGRRPVATLFFKATDTSGNSSSARRRVTLVRPRGAGS